MKPKKIMVRLALVLLVGATALAGGAPARAATQSDFEAAYRAAAEAERQAGALRNQWMPTEAALKAAEKAAAAKDYDAAVALARRAQALAEASIEQAKAQDQLWQNAVLK
ncbi:MAG TPA: hypothetical protein VMA53_08335 [Stellaceae bacterium]|nr:hypothetical protein [Stellaceae bacterium]